MKGKIATTLALSMVIATATIAPTARALELTSGDWTFAVNGNINVYYVYSSCESAASAEPITTVGGACTGTANGSSVSNVGNGLLPAALTFGISTTQAGFDIAAHFGFYPGVSTNDAGSPNLQQGAPEGTNVALGTTGLDVRQVYMTFGNKNLGTFTFGRNFGLFEFDAIINDMTLPGVGPEFTARPLIRRRSETTASYTCRAHFFSRSKTLSPASTHPTRTPAGASMRT